MARKIAFLRNGGAILTESAINFSGTVKTVDGAVYANAQDASRYIQDPTYPMPTEIFSIEIQTIAIDAIVTVIP